MNPVKLSSFAMLGVLCASPSMHSFIREFPPIDGASFEAVDAAIRSDDLPYITYMKLMKDKVIEMDNELQGCESEVINPKSDGPLH